MALSQTTIVQKRKRFSASNITPSKVSRVTDPNNDTDGSEIIVAVRNWGSAFNVFESLTRDDPLWQLQVIHGGRNAFGYQVLAVAREALLKHPNNNIRDLQQLESVLNVRLLNGAPPHTGALDPDGTGIEAWQVVLYTSSVTNALDFIHLVLKHKVAKGHLLQLPNMTVACPDGSVESVPEPWTLNTNPPHCPKAFAVLPPRGRRHVLCQVELSGSRTTTASSQDSKEEPEPNTEVEDKNNTSTLYTFSFFGGIYSYRELFDAANVEGGYNVGPEGNRDYVRTLEVLNNQEGKDRLMSLHEQVLLNVPIYLVDATENPDDEFVAWFASLPHIELGERASS